MKDTVVSCKHFKLISVSVIFSTIEMLTKMIIPITCRYLPTIIFFFFLITLAQLLQSFVYLCKYMNMCAVNTPNS